jgi:hypothetical protein
LVKPLIFNSDIKAIEKKVLSGCVTALEADLLRHAKLSESQIQQACRRIFLSKFGDKAKFIQIDNGGNLSIAMKVKKAREGTIPGMVDALLIGKKRAIFVEFKRVGNPSSIEPKPEQKEIHDFLKKCEFSVYVTNNTVFFEKVICEEFANV